MRPNKEVINGFLKRAVSRSGEIVRFVGRIIRLIGHFVGRSWKSIALWAPVVILSYYIVGGYVSDRIDKTTDFELNRPKSGLTVVDATASLIRREVDDHLWTPNLPIIFPGYVLDNMPRFQSGMIWSLRILSQTLKRNFDLREAGQADDFLKYPTNIWLISKNQNLKLVPSSGAQYRKARQALLRFNEEVQTDTLSEAFLIDLLQRIEKKLSAIDSSLQKHAREESPLWIDFKADDVFYENQGRLYGLYVILKAVSVDYENEIVQADQYQAWTSMLKTLADGIHLEPMLVRNGKPDASLSPNHLLLLDLYAVKTRYDLNGILNVLKKENNDADSH